MELILHRSRVNAFLTQMDLLGEKFNDKYIDGELSEYCKLAVVNKQPDMVFIKPVPEVVKIACYTCFINTLLQ